jgi:hypothetical protein
LFVRPAWRNHLEVEDHRPPDLKEKENEKMLRNTDQEKKLDLKSMADKWPSSVVARTEVPTFTGGSLSEKYIANLDSLGKGPDGRFRIGRKICYPVNSLIAWLESRATLVD